MKKIILLAAVLYLSLPLVLAQDSNKFNVTVYGFVRNYLNYDSRKTYTVVGGEYNMFPYDEARMVYPDQPGSLGIDLNDVASLQFQALTSRLGVAVSGPTLYGWGTSGKIEADFGGFGTTNTVLRLRLAYVNLERQNAAGNRHSSLVIGQDWHPLSGDIMPEVLGMAAGAPFRPHSRTPQIRATQYWGPFGYSAALLWQLQYMNNGPEGPSSLASVASLDFANHALWPEAFLGLNFRQGGWYAQVGVDAQVLRPRTHGSINGRYVEVDESVASLTPTLYAQYVGGRWSVKFRTMMAQNTSHLNQLVGYGITGVDAEGQYQYAPLNASISYLNIACGSRVRTNLFLGYMKNLGAWAELMKFDQGYHIYVKGGDSFTHLNSAYRVAPSISYNLPHFNFGIEYEWTACTFGDLSGNGSIKLNDNLHQVDNHRVCVMVKYNFGAQVR